MSQYPGNPYAAACTNYAYPSPIMTQQFEVPVNPNLPNSCYAPLGTTNIIGNYQPIALPVDQIENVPGYENTTFTSTILPPPPPFQPELPTRPSERQTANRGAGLTEEEIREAAINYVSQHCCYGKDPVKNMVITDIIMSSAFHYTLETFTEKRETKWQCDPYNGGILQIPIPGTAPAPWDIPLTSKHEFTDSVQTIEVPHTASVKLCHVCRGVGKQKCSTCNGSCMELCTWCHGNGKRIDNSICRDCNGSGRNRCSKCYGSGQANCHICDGKGNLRFYVKLTATWKNHYDDYIVERTSLPSELIRNVTGDVVFEEHYPRVCAVDHFQPNINEASQQLVQKHNQAFQLERMLQQRHRIRIIPIAQASYNWNDKTGKFFVYGFENKVHFPDYPQSCCCGCSIL